MFKLCVCGGMEWIYSFVVVKILPQVVLRVEPDWHKNYLDAYYLHNSH